MEKECKNCEWFNSIENRCFIDEGKCYPERTECEEHKEGSWTDG